MSKLSKPTYTLKKDFVSVVIDGKPFSLDASHPTFPNLVKAIKAKNWLDVSKFVSIAKTIHEETLGQIVVKDEAIYYNGQLVDNSLTKRILEMVKERKAIKHMLRFMDNLNRNPFGIEAIKEFYTWLDNCKMPITDDGCFVAYKAVDHDYMDHYSHTVDNSLGRIVVMPNNQVDTNRRNECSYGLHFCSRGYLPGFHFGQSRVMKIKINPKDVVSVPYNEAAKGRCRRYEVIGEVEKDEIEKLRTDDIKEYMTSVVPVAANRKELLERVINHPLIKRTIKRGKILRSTILRASYGRLQKMAAKLPAEGTQIVIPEKFKALEFPLMNVRKASGITQGQIAKKLGVPLKSIVKLEKNDNTGDTNYERDSTAYLNALAELMGIRNIRQSAISYPKPEQKPQPAA